MHVDVISSLVLDPIQTVRRYGFNSVEQYQRWHSLVPDDVVGPITSTLMTQPRCGCPDYQPSRPPEEASWPRSCLDVGVAYRLQLNLDSDAVGSAWSTALNIWNESCGINLELIESMQEAQIWAKSGPLPGSTLAWSYLPNGNCRENLEQKYDSEQQWNHDFLGKVVLHEIGHALGLTHSRRKADIMYPTITGRDLSSYPSPNDKGRVVELYGEAAPIPRDNDPPFDPELPINSRITITGRPLSSGTYTLRKV